MPRRPRIFIGSSTQGLKYAEALHARLDLKCEATVWTHNVFHVSKSTLENLVEKAHAVDFGALVLTPDDLLTRADDVRLVARDNVLFEAGLFMGTLGPERTFLVRSRDQAIALPTDLAGITQATWGDREDGNWDAALSVPARELLQAMKEVRQDSGRDETLFDGRNGVAVDAWTVEYRDGAQGGVGAHGNNVLRIERPTRDGKVWLRLNRPVARGDGGEAVAVHIRGEVRTLDGEHTVTFVFKEDGSPSGTHLLDLRTRAGVSWQPLAGSDETHALTLRGPCRIRLEHRSVSSAPSAVEIRDLVISITRYPFDLDP